MCGLTWIASLAIIFGAQTPAAPPSQIPPPGQLPANQSPTPQNPANPGQTPTIPPQVPSPGPAQPVPAPVPSSTVPVVVPQTGYAAGGYPMSAISSTPTGSAPQAPTIVNAKINDLISLGTLQYRVVSVTPGLSTYLLHHDQRGARLTPGFKKDRLVVVEVEVTNPSPLPASFTGLAPSLVDANGAMTNRPQWDVRQQSFVRSTGDSSGAALRFDTYLTPEDSGPYGDTTDAIMVAPGGHVRFALIFSEPAMARPASVRFDNTQGYGTTANTVGVVTIQ